MTTKPQAFESQMLIEVRRWRKEAYEADRTRSPDERAKHREELLAKFGLPRRETRRNRRAPKAASPE